MFQVIQISDLHVFNLKFYQFVTEQGPFLGAQRPERPM